MRTHLRSPNLGYLLLGARQNLDVPALFSFVGQALLSRTFHPHGYCAESIPNYSDTEEMVKNNMTMKRDPQLHNFHNLRFNKELFVWFDCDKLPHFDVKNIFLAQKVKNWQHFKGNP